MYLASSDIDPDQPYRSGFSFEELTKMIQKSRSTRIVVILDCCYSGSARISNGNEEVAAKIGQKAIDNKGPILGQGKYILSASQATQEAFALATGEHSVFTSRIMSDETSSPSTLACINTMPLFELCAHVKRSAGALVSGNSSWCGFIPVEHSPGYITT